LKITVNTIQEVFDGRLGEFLKYEQPYLSEELKIVLDQQWQHLPEFEQTIIACISREYEPVSLNKLLVDSQLNYQQLFKIIQSLKRRFLIESNEKKQESLFTVSEILRHYVRSINKSER
jgi:hypothetical protein